MEGCPIEDLTHKVVPFKGLQGHLMCKGMVIHFEWDQNAKANIHYNQPYIIYYTNIKEPLEFSVCGGHLIISRTCFKC